MQERKDKEQEKATRKRRVLNKEKRFYLVTALGCAVALSAIVIVAVAVSNANKMDQNQAQGGNSGNQIEQPDQPSGGNNNAGNDDEQVIVTPQGMVMPLETANVSNEYGFYHNQTLNSYYEHKGIDFVATAGTEVLAVEAGVIESIYKEDLLSGTQIVVDHGEGLKSVYCFVEETEGLKVGDSVEKGDVIATVAEANGNEYKDGAHLHFEIVKNNINVDPAIYLTLEEK